MNHIAELRAREIFDSRGLPTIEVFLQLSSNQSVCASVPTGQSRSSFEPQYCYDTDRFYGLGVRRAVSLINEKIAPLLIGQEPDILAMDQILLGLDCSAKKSAYGANTLLAVSIAVCKAHAIVDNMELFELIAYLCDLQIVSMPFGMFNIINGGVHADSGLQVQEILITPLAADSFAHSYMMACQTFYVLKKLLKERGFHTLVGDEGGFAPPITSLEEVLDLVHYAIEKVGFANNILIGLDIAASQFFDPITKLYTYHNQQKTSEELIEYYQNLLKKYEIYSIEDGLADSDWDGWMLLTKRLGSQVQLVGDDLFSSNAHRIAQGIEMQAGNTVLIKPSQVGTVTETLQAIKLCLTYEIPFIISHRSGETNDTFIADLALGSNATHIKAGGCSRGERVAKYNHLMLLEQKLIGAQYPHLQGQKDFFQ